jgi:glycine/D-amino acid oxidase-like deaminating enzyme
MRVAVLGGGLQGCGTALALSRRGVDVTLYDRNAALLSRTAVANEGKIHLGYMYAADPTFATARTMMRGALAFGPFLERYLERPMESFATSFPASYLVHRDSQHTVEEVAVYLDETHRLIGEASNGRKDSYFGLDLTAPLRRWTDGDRAAAFDPEIAVAAFYSPEVALEPIQLAAEVRKRVAEEPRIKLRLGRLVTGVSRQGDAIVVTGEGSEGISSEPFDQVVNALWEGRLAIDRQMGLEPDRPWLHRLKHGVSFTLPKDSEPPPSATFISGPFGEVVSYPDGLTYLTWYPECIKGYSSELTPPHWPTHPTDPLRSQILEGTLSAMAEMVPALRRLSPETLLDAKVKGGAIFAWGKTDIYDPNSELHQRYDIGVHSTAGYHSIDPGKLTMAPYFAEVCASRITGSL